MKNEWKNHNRKLNHQKNIHSFHMMMVFICYRYSHATRNYFSFRKIAINASMNIFSSFPEFCNVINVNFVDFTKNILVKKNKILYFNLALTNHDHSNFLLSKMICMFVLLYG